MKTLPSHVLNLVAASPLLASIASAGVTPIYQVQDLPIPIGATEARATALNSRGDAVGHAILGDGRVVPAIWPVGREPLMLDVQAGYATDVNSSGTVGGYFDDGNQRQSFRWKDGMLTHIADPRGSLAAIRIGENDRVYGNVNTSSDGAHAAVETAGGIRLLTGVEGATSITGVNRAGVVVGNTNSRSNLRAGFVADAAGDMTEIVVSGIAEFLPIDINDGSIVVGAAGRLPERAAVASKQFRGLLQNLDGFEQSSAGKINNQNQIIGSVGDLTGFDTRPVFWDSPFERPRDINDLIHAPNDWRITALYDISDSGAMLGLGAKDGRTFPVVIHPATAVPLPPAALAALTVVPMIVGWKRIRRGTRPPSNTIHSNL